VSAPGLVVFSPSGVVARPAALTRALRQLSALGFEVRRDAAALARHRRFAGDDATRLAALHRVADEAPSVALATRGGYGLTRLLDAIDWRRLARSVERGTRWVGHSDFTALQLGLLAHGAVRSWAGPMAVDDFGRPSAAGADDDGDEEDAVITREVFAEAMHGQLEAVGFRTDAGFDGLQLRGTLWGGNLSMLLSLLGTRHWPRVERGVLFLEDVNEHPYRVERALLQLHQAGVLARQRAVLLGDFSGWKPSPLDRGWGLTQVIAGLRSTCRVPLLTGLPFGHRRLKLTLPVGARVTLAVQGRQALMGW
jgi:muramoyltetrapeptide carboxypeptidase